MNLRSAAALSALLLVLTACGGGTATSTPPTTIFATTTTTNAPVHGPAVKSVSFDITTGDGYKASLAVNWYQETPVTPSGVFKACRGEMAWLGWKMDNPQLVMVAVVAEVTAAFPQTAGFVWPAGKHLSVTHGNGLSNQSLACFDESGTTVNTTGRELQLNDYKMSPAKPAMKIMWVRAGEKSPNNPEGKPKGDPTRFEIKPQVPSGGTCTASDKGIAAKSCSTQYGK